MTFLLNSFGWNNGGAGSSGSLSFQGTWDANTNNPTLTSGVGTQGHYYIVSVAGNTNLDGITLWEVGDFAIFNGTVWQKIDNADFSKGFSLVFKNSNNVTVSQFLRILQNLPSNTDPYLIPEQCILYGIIARTASINFNQNWSAEVYINNVLIPSATINLNNVQSLINIYSNPIILNANDLISVRCNKIGTANILRPYVQLFIKGITA
jgi:hypothetical protein